MSDEVVYKVSKGEYLDMFGKIDNDEIVRAVNELYMAEVIFNNPEDKKGKYITRVRFLQSCSYGDGEVSFRFSKDVLPLINELERNFTTFKLTNIVGLDSSYSVRLFQLAASVLRVKKDRLEFTIEGLKAILGIKDKYKEYRDFKKDVLVPCINEINKEQKVLVMGLVEGKVGRKVVKVVLVVKRVVKEKKLGYSEREKVEAKVEVGRAMDKVGKRKVKCVMSV
jgi:plasmid replication initiation protein